MKKNAQSAIEFVIIVGAVIFFFVIFFGLIAQSSVERNRWKLENEFSSTLNQVQTELNLASGASDGYIRSFTIPQKIQGNDYSISIIENSIYMNSTRQKYASSLSSPNVTGQLLKGSNSIKKINGTIFLNP